MSNRKYKPSKPSYSRALRKLINRTDNKIYSDEVTDKLLKKVSSDELVQIASSFGLFPYYRCEIRLRAIHLLDNSKVLEEIASNTTRNTTGPYMEMEAKCLKAACSKLGHIMDKCVCTRCSECFHNSVNCKCITCGADTHDFITVGETVVSEEIRKKIDSERHAYGPVTTSVSIYKCTICGETKWTVFWED